MSLTAKDVEEITRLLEQSAFDELDLEIDGLKLHLRRGASADVSQQDGQASADEPLAGPSSPPLVGTGNGGEERGADPALHEVAAPLLGTFYRAPRPGAPPFVDVGSAVEEDTIVGIIEVMKLMNTVRAGVRGTVERIVAQDGMLVEYGEMLLRVRKA